jgi:hypothetical protein
MELRSAQADAVAVSRQHEERGQAFVRAAEGLEAFAEFQGGEGSAEATTEERARAGRSGGVAFHGLVLRRREGVPAVRSVVKRCAAGMMSNGMEFQTGTPGWAENWPRTLLCPTAEVCPAGRRRFFKII